MNTPNDCPTVVLNQLWDMLDAVYTIDGSDEQFDTPSAASFAASTKVATEQRSVNVYRNGQLYETRRF